MKTTVLRNWTVVCLSVLTAVMASRASADQSATTSKPENDYTGTVQAVDPTEHTLDVKGWVFSKEFKLGDDCNYNLVDNQKSSVADLRPGQKVKVSYQDVGGVLVADRVEQIAMRHEGKIKEINAEQHTMTIHTTGLDKTFRIADDCKVEFKNGKYGMASDLKTGQYVSVLYESPEDGNIARAIEQTSEEFTGTLTAIDLNERMVKAKSTFSSEKFYLAKGCSIEIPGKDDAKFRDLKPGDKLTFSYDEVNGVNIVTSISAAESTPEAQTAQSSQSHPY